jgi:outer membrane receptor for ferrienterochelin and colicin
MRFKITLLFFLALTASLSAQIDLEVTVYEANVNTPMADVPVAVSNPAVGFSMVKNTDARGKAVFYGVPVAGAYSVAVAETEVFYGTQKSDIILRSNTNQSVAIPLFRKEYLLEEFVVQGATKINARNAEVASELRQKEIETLPVEGRDITRVLYRLPNVVQATGFYPEAPNVGINGANGLFTNYLIDGMDNNERFLGGMKFNIPVGFVSNINALTNNFSTEYGLTGNGVINITSRSGSNETSGEAFVVTRPGAVLDAESPYAQRDLSGNQVLDGFQRYQAGFGLGGALRPDKTFYYLNAEFTRDLKDNLLNSPALGVNETVRGENNFSYFSGKIDRHWTDRFRSSLRANLGVVNIARQGGGLTGGVDFPSAANLQDRNSALVASQHTFTGDQFKSETNVQYSRFRWNYARTANPNSPNVTVLDPAGLTAARLGHPGYLFDATENTVQAQQKITLYRDRHTFKAGMEVLSSRHELLGGGNPNGSYIVQLNESQLAAVRALNKGAGLDLNDIPADVQVLAYNVELRPAAFGATQNIFSAYIEDAWTVTNKLNLTLGLRYDYDNLSKGGSDKGDFDNIAPRFSFNFQPGGNSSIRGGYGIFYDKILYGVYSDALQQNTTDADYKRQLQALKDQGILPAGTDLDRITFDGNIGASANNVTYLQGPSYEELQGNRARAFSGERRILNPNGYQNPYTHQFSLGYQHQVDEKRLFYVDIVRNESRNLFRLRDLNAPAAYPLDDPENVIVRTQAQADATRPVAIDPGGFAIIGADTVRGVARNVVVSETAGKSQYTALSLNFQKDRGDDQFAYRFTYTLSKLENDTEDINFKAMDANNFDREWAPGINDRTHVINGIASYYPWKRFSVTLAALIQSGQPINRIPDATVYGTTDLNGDGRSFGDAYVGNSDRQPGETRNNDRLPWANTFDLAGEYALPTGNTGRLILRADVLNLFNAANLSGYANNATQSNQVQTGPKASGLLVRRNASAPRQIQLSLRWVF